MSLNRISHDDENHFGSAKRDVADGVAGLDANVALNLSPVDQAALILGGPAAEGGDIKVYRDASGNLQMSLDADAASNAKALDIYGGVVCQNYLTAGQSALSTDHTLYVAGSARITGIAYIDNSVAAFSNAAAWEVNVPVTGTDATNHSIKFDIDDNSILEIKATGDGAGGIIDKAIGLYGTTPATQAAAISDPAESTAGNNAAIDSILAALRGIGLIAT